jgi:hypothetical protein
MIDDEPVVRHVRRGLQASLLGLIFSYGGAVSLGPWRSPDDVNSTLLLVFGVTIASFSLSLRAIGRLAEAVKVPRPWLKPLSIVSSALGIGIAVLAAAYLAS